jgi:hypothetical protein
MEICRLKRFKEIPCQQYHVKESTLLHGVASMRMFEHYNTNDN